MRREGFELDRRQAAGGHPEIDGKLHEPVERLTIDVPEEYLGAITQLLAVRKGRMEQHDQPRHRLGPDGVPRARPAA